MHYVSVERLGKSYGIQPLFENISFHISEGDKISLVARNGTGKSTLLKILAGKETPDDGKIWINKDVDVVLLEQEPVFIENKSVLDNIFFHDHPIINAIKEFEAISEEGDPVKLNTAISTMDELGAWDFDARVKQVLSKLNIHHLQQPVSNLSGGQRKRVALAKTLIDIGFEHKHVLLIMDEPTNHLDVEMVEWLERWLDKENITLLLVTHDRYFLDAVCNEIWELDNNNLFVYKGDYANYLERKAARLENESAGIDKARNTYRRELEWMRRQPKARTTKSKSRQDHFYAVEKKAKQQIVNEQLQLDVKMNRLGGKVIEVKKISKSYDGKVILKGFDYTFKKGERIGIVGKNGVGKTTFINILQGIEKPDSGKVNIGDTVVFGNYSQQGLVLKEDMRVIEFVKTMAESFPLAGGGSLSAAQFLQLFLFDPDKQFTYISRLSGGEKRRLHLLALLFRNPNFLVLDEPTNDLDLPTLNVLENFLSEFPGCLLIVSHDRYFMDRLVDHLFVFEGDGVIRDFPGNYSQYREDLSQSTVSSRQSAVDSRQSAVGSQQSAVGSPQSAVDSRQSADGSQQSAVDSRESAVGSQQSVVGNQQLTSVGNDSSVSKRQFTFKEKREFGQLEKEIAELSAEKEMVTEKLNSGTTPFVELQQLSVRIGELTRLLDEKELRWLELSELR